MADLLALQSHSPQDESKSELADLDLQSCVHGLQAGVDPSPEEYWGKVGNHDQRMVEMEPIAYALLATPSVFSSPCSSAAGIVPLREQQKENIKTWLRSINEREVPPSNWRWFRVLVNLALVKSCDVPYNEVKRFMDADFKVLDSFYRGEGGSSDGLWCDEKRQADYYSGSFAIQYSQLAYVRFAHDIDPERCERYRAEAGKFAVGFWRYFDVDGEFVCCCVYK